MDVTTTYQFLKPSLEKFSDQEKKELCKLILSEEPQLQKKKKPKTREQRIADKKRRLLATGLFKN